MGGLFDSPEPPPPPPPPPAPAPAPTIDTAAQSARKTEDSRLNRRGRAATVLTSPQGDLSETKTATKALLGG